MKTSTPSAFNRRSFLRATTGFLVASAMPNRVRAGDRPAVTNPRATSGDRIEPNWDERLTLTVGP